VRFFAFTGEGKSGEVFTFNPLYHSFLSPKGEGGEAKTEKPAAARAGGARWGQFRKLRNEVELFWSWKNDVQHGHVLSCGLWS